jgi:hypothetical protein
MKKIFLAVVLVLAASSLLISGAVYAQGAGGGRGAMSNSEGRLHDFIIKAYADALGLTTEALEARLDNGETAYQIAFSQGIAADQIPAVLAEARLKALESAVAAGVITSDQAAWMMTRGFGQGGYGHGIGIGTCNGTGQPIGQGMQRGGRQPANP